MKTGIYIPIELMEIYEAVKADAKAQRQGVGWILLKAWQKLHETR